MSIQAKAIARNEGAKGEYFLRRASDEANNNNNSFYYNTIFLALCLKAMFLV